MEDNYWWHVGKRGIVRSLIIKLLSRKKVLDLKEDLKILDVGCGAGRWLEELEKITKGESWGIDKEPEAINFCKERGLKNLKIVSAEKIPFPDCYFDLITCLDLLEHIDNDKEALAEICRVLKPCGFLIISVPAYKRLFSYWDEMLHHKRRYEIEEIKNLLEKNTFRIFKLTYSNFFIFLPSIFVRLLKSKQKKTREISDFMPVPSFANKFLIFLYKIEAFLLTKTNLPFGLSILAIVQK
ncbi:MAG: class I SAM-dependent methyltransferase [bacterium]